MTNLLVYMKLNNNDCYWCVSDGSCKGGSYSFYVVVNGYKYWDNSTPSSWFEADKSTLRAVLPTEFFE